MVLSLALRYFVRPVNGEHIVLSDRPRWDGHESPSCRRTAIREAPVTESLVRAGLSSPGQRLFANAEEQRWPIGLLRRRVSRSAAYTQPLWEGG